MNESGVEIPEEVRLTESREPQVEPPIETISSPEYFDTAVVLGAGIEKSSNGVWRPRLESKMRTLAAGIVASEGRVGRLIISGGRTAGKEAPSEAQAMKDYLLKKFPELTELPIDLEDESFDTIQNSKRVKEMVGEGRILLITNSSHILRAAKNFENQGLIIKEIPAEEVLRDTYHQHQVDGKTVAHFPYEKFIANYLRSTHARKRQAVEAVLRGIAKVDPDGKLLTVLAKKLRHGEEI